MDQTKMNVQVYPGFDGKIAFASNRNSNKEIYVMNAADDIAQTRLTDNGGGSFAPTWSPEAIFGFFSNRFK